ncbi:hypothetical protein [Actinomadura parmotrematis]|uniref:Serine/threonine protein kinase n=1 Tax=Actinomadura parmotrematis TaxID=2864039 RepID=A0ABS7FYE6_9ACTN|nr:hypothetical protein [Actinomadura parmotrematis]MBW8485291.1 hypothetical protein [Actinomadura parmotrematis]
MLAVLLVGGGLVLLLVIVAVVAVVAKSDDKPRRPLTLPSVTYGVPTTRPTTGTGTDVLGPTIRTAKGNTFTRGGSRTASCIARANSDLLTELASHPCVGQMQSALYMNPGQTVTTVVSIAKFASSSDASAISSATNGEAEPTLLYPTADSGLPRPSGKPGYWTRSWSQGSTVVYAQSYPSRGGQSGDRSGTVFLTAGELGTEVTNTILWSN